MKTVSVEGHIKSLSPIFIWALIPTLCNRQLADWLDRVKSLSPIFIWALIPTADIGSAIATAFGFRLSPIFIWALIPTMVVIRGKLHDTSDDVSVPFSSGL